MSEADMAALPYRRSAGLVVVNGAGRVFAGRRLDSPGDAWQMPQGGIEEDENPRCAALRELEEETGIPPSAVEYVAETDGWISYDLPAELIPRLWGGRYRGQSQKWFLLRFTGTDDLISIDTEHPEFSDWAWMRPAVLISKIVPFKRAAYYRVFEEFAEYLGDR